MFLDTVSLSVQSFESELCRYYSEAMGQNLWRQVYLHTGIDVYTISQLNYVTITIIIQTKNSNEKFIRTFTSRVQGCRRYRW